MKFDFNLWWAKKSFSGDGKFRQRIYLMLSKMLVNSVPLADAVSEINSLSMEKGRQHPHVVMFSAWLRELNNGHPLAKALRGWAPDDERLLIAAGEESGFLAESLIHAKDNLEGKSQIKSSLVGALAYPLVLTIAAVGLAWFFSASVIPKFADVLPSDQWVGLAKLTLQVSGIVRDWIFVGVGVAVAVLIALILSLSRWVGRWRTFADKMIPFSIYRMMNGVSFMSSLSAMISAGTSLQDSISKIEFQVKANPYLRSRIGEILRHVRNGKDVGESMKLAKHGFPDKEIIDSLCIYGRYSGFDKALSSIAADWRKEGVESIKQKAGVLFMISLLLMGGVVGFFSAGLFAVANQVTASAQKH